ncbi:OmpA family protein [Sphingomonas sp. NCPPB 2930]
MAPRSFWRAAAATVASLCLCATALAADVAGARDHPLLTRFKGAEIAHYQTSDFDEVAVPVRPIADDKKIGAADLARLEGKVTRIGYRLAGSKTSLEVMRNYQDALASSGFKPVFQCAGAACGTAFDGYVANGGTVMPAGFDATFNDKSRYLVAQRADAQGTAHVLLYVMQDESNQRVLVYEQVVESRAMAQGQVSVRTAAELRKGLEEEGRVAVYGIYFDTAKAEVKPESRPSLDEMAKLLAAQPALRVYIVGHTDNAGSLAANLDLSQRRAEAVVKALAGYKIDAQRMVGKGVASLAPVASNASEAGRGRNRRVELVLQ